MIAVIGLIIGIVLGILLDPTVPAWLAPFLPVAVVAGLDALFGAGRAWLEGRFADRVFVTSFFWNVVVACLLVFLGSQLGVGSAMTPPSLWSWAFVSSPIPHPSADSY